MVQRLARIERVLQSGSTFPSLVTSESGRRYVLKLAGAGPGTRSLATEYVALKLAEHLGLNVPAPELIEVPRQFPWQTGTDEFYETVQRSAGWNLGVTFVPNARDLASSDLIPCRSSSSVAWPALMPCCKTSIEEPPIRTSCATSGVSCGPSTSAPVSLSNASRANRPSPI